MELFAHSDGGGFLILPPHRNAISARKSPNMALMPKLRRILLSNQQIIEQAAVQEDIPPPSTWPVVNH
jgi:hypothetical protein